MSRRRKRGVDGFDKVEALVKGGLMLLVLLALCLGGIGDFAAVFTYLLKRAILWLLLIILVGATGVVGYYLIRYLRNWNVETDAAGSSASVEEPQAEDASVSVTHVSEETDSLRTTRNESSVQAWSDECVLEGLGTIDWYQYEKFCEALLSAEGYLVERKGGAKPDGGVDLIASRGGVPCLVQCKHWRSWAIQEKIVREMLGSMTHYGVSSGMIITMKGWTIPASKLACQHAITLVDGQALARRACLSLPPERLEALLHSPRQCPICDSPMVLREGKFPSFWGCRTFPRCRGVIKTVGAR